MITADQQRQSEELNKAFGDTCGLRDLLVQMQRIGLLEVQRTQPLRS